MDEASERSLSLLRTLSQEHIKRSNQIHHKNCTRDESLEQSHNSYPNDSLNSIRKLNQSFVSALFSHNDNSNNNNSNNSNNNSNHKKNTSKVQSIHTHSDYTNMGNEHSSQDHHRQIDVESRLAYNDYFEENASKRQIKQQRQSSSKSFTSRNSSRSTLSHNSVDDMMYNEKAQQYYSLDELVDQNIYIVKQKAGYCAILFSLVQTLILAAMMIECSVAPLYINPMIGPYPDALDYWGAKNATKILDDNEWWRLITPLFLHGGIIHLLCNISVQLDIGAFFEREWGSGLWLFIYFASGTGSSIFSCIFSADNLSVGSSGAVMGLFGGKLAEIFCRACESQKSKAARVGHEVRMEQLQQSLCSVVIVLAFSFVPFIDWAAHLGGVISGFAAGILCFATWIESKRYAVFWFATGLTMNLIFYISTLTYFYTSVQPRNDLGDVCGYYKQFFEDYECNCQLDN